MTSSTRGASLLRLMVAIVLFVLSGCAGTSSAEPSNPTATAATAAPQSESDDFCAEQASSGSSAKASADLDGDGHADTVVVADLNGATFIGVCGSERVVAPFEVGNNKPVQIYAIDVDADGTAELLVGTTTGAGPFAGTLLSLVDSKLVDQRISVTVTPPRAGSSKGESFSCVDVDSNGVTELASVAYQLDASDVAQATTIMWTYTAVAGDAAGVTREGAFNIASERSEALALMNGTCGDQIVIVGITDSELAAPPTAQISAESQAAVGAHRDGVVPAVANLPYDLRVDPLVTEPTDDGDWVLSRLTGEVIDASTENGCRLGPPDGEYLTDVVCAIEYGEILLTDVSGQIHRAYPMPAAIPSWIHVTPSRIYAGRLGDGALPHSTVVRIDRATLAATVVLVPTGLEGVNPDAWPADWRIASEGQVAIYVMLVGFSPDMVGTPAASWIGDVVIDITGIDTFIDSFNPAD